MDSDKPIVMCRRASDYRKPGTVTGYFCRACGKELQVSPGGVRQISELGGVPYCNPCAMTLVQKFNALGRSSDVVLSEGAQQQLKERGVFDQFIGDKPVIEITPEEFFDAAKLRERLRRTAGN